MRMAKIKILKIPNAGENVEQQELSSIAGENAKLYSNTRKRLDSFI